MIARRTGLLVAALLAVAALPVSADIGEDFEPAGIAIAGSGSFLLDLGRILDSSSQYSFWTLTLGPEIDALLLEDVAMFVAPYLTYNSTQNDPSNIFRSMHYGADIGFRWYLVANPKAQMGCCTGSHRGGRSPVRSRSRKPDRGFRDHHSQPQHIRGSQPRVAPTLLCK